MLRPRCLLMTAVLLASGCEPTQENQSTSSESTSGETVSAQSEGSVDDSGNLNAEGLDGAEKARVDISNGKLILREQPLPNPPWYNKYSDLLRDECGVTIEVIRHASAPAFTDADLAYNKVMTAEIERLHGKGIIGKLRQQAQD